jgi:hypothetical protein
MQPRRAKRTENYRGFTHPCKTFKLSFLLHLEAYTGFRRLEHEIEILYIVYIEQARSAKGVINDIHYLQSTCKKSNMPITVAARSKVRDASDYPYTGIVGSNPIRGVYIYLHFIFSLFSLL